MSSVVISGDTSGSITVAAPAVAGTNTITLPAYTGTAALTSNTSVLISTTTITNASTLTNVTSSMTSAGWYLINMNYALNVGTTATQISIRTSTDNGTTFDSGAANYSTDLPNAGAIATSNNIAICASNTANAAIWMNNTIYLYTGSATNMSFMEIKNSNGNGTTINTLSGSQFSARTALSQINAFQVLRISGARVFTGGTIRVYYLGQG